MKRKYFHADPKDLENPNYLGSERTEVHEFKANLVSSIEDSDSNDYYMEIDNAGDQEMRGMVQHLPVLDLDFPCELIQSSPGKFHLYMNRRVGWLDYQNVLTALSAAGLLEPGYVAASIQARATFVRKPGTLKTVKQSPSQYKPIK